MFLKSFSSTYFVAKKGLYMFLGQNNINDVDYKRLKFIYCIDKIKKIKWREEQKKELYKNYIYEKDRYVFEDW